MPEHIPWSSSGPRVLIEHSDYLHINKGDVAMLAVAARRIRDQLPDARIGVITEAAPLLRIYVPDVEPVHPWGRAAWLEPRAPALNVLRSPLAIGAAVDLGNSCRRARTRLGVRARALAGAPGGDPSPVEAVVPRNTGRALSTASLVLGLGGGYLTDVDPGQAHRLLALLHAAAKQGVPCALVGQGIGPLEGADLVRHAAQTLPHVSYIGLREGTYGPEALARVGVAPKRFSVTGDDAIELAHEVRRPEVGHGLGICLRIADYSPVSAEVRGIVGMTVRSVASDHDAWLFPVQISEYHVEDRKATMPLVRGYPRVRRPLGRHAHPRDIARRISSCRVLVTGAYHAAVFALAQGIPVVALSSSPYYDVKFQGLSAMFEGGLDVVSLAPAGLGRRLRGAIDTAWDAAPEVRRSLLDQARSQVEASREAYTHVLADLEARIDGPGRR